MTASSQNDDGAPPEPGAADELTLPLPPAAFVIPRELAQATLNYLAAQPYREVYTLVQAFEALEPARVDHLTGDARPAS